MGILNPGIGDFFKSGDFLKGDISEGIGDFEDFLSPGFYGNEDFLGMVIFCVGWDIPQKAKWHIITNFSSSTVFDQS